MPKGHVSTPIKDEGFPQFEVRNSKSKLTPAEYLQDFRLVLFTFTNLEILLSATDIRIFATPPNLAVHLDTLKLFVARAW